MARENYLSLSVTPSEMQIFDCFVKEKGLTKRLRSKTCWRFICWQQMKRRI